jgi:hypothetical protein
VVVVVGDAVVVVADGCLAAASLQAARTVMPRIATTKRVSLLRVAVRS